MQYYLVYDGNCNLCVNFTKALEQIDKGQVFSYTPMQAKDVLDSLGISESDCEQGMILIDKNNPDRRWQGSEAAEVIASLLPMGEPLIAMYRAIPSFKWLGDRLYAQVRDNRYQWFGQGETTYTSKYPIDCQCQPK